MYDFAIAMSAYENCTSVFIKTLFIKLKLYLFTLTVHYDTKQHLASTKPLRVYGVEVHYAVQ